MNDYHAYVFDESSRRFVGRFEEMYRAEQRCGFDSWHQDDVRNLTKRICSEVTPGYNFDRILDVGCGKGAFTQLLKRHNNKVVGIDISESALAVARARCPDVEFVAVDAVGPSFDAAALGGPFDLVVCLELLSYVESWRDLLGRFAAIGRYTLIGLYLPENPIGFVKSLADLVGACAERFDMLEDIRLQVRRQIVLFMESRRFASQEMGPVLRRGRG